MPDLLRIEGINWSLNVWSRDVSIAQKQLRETIRARGGADQRQEVRIDLSGVRTIQPLPCLGPAGFELRDVVFFENRSYEFEFTFPEGTAYASVIHRLNLVQDSFRIIGHTLRGTINFGNDIGWFRLEIAYEVQGRRRAEQLAFNVFPTKMDLERDLNRINFEIDRSYPLWRFSFAQKTVQELSNSFRPHERFPLLWLAQFQALREELLNQVRIVCNAPHSRLQQTDRKVRMDRLKGRLESSLEERVHADQLQGHTDSFFRVRARRLSVDTPENRFVLMVLRHTSRELAQFAVRARRHNGSPDRERVSESFFNEIESWRLALEQRMAHPMFADVGRFEDMERESLVLHQRVGYSGVYRVWQHLKQYLDVFGRSATISTKSVAELYEVWCLLEIRRLLIALGFVERETSSPILRLKGLEKELENGIGASFRFARDDGLNVRLAHEPIYKKPGLKVAGIFSWSAVQKPDIVLEAIFPNGEMVHWIFDAKYRVDTTQQLTDLVPDDAINQMHRYRDALILLNESQEGAPQKSRPVIGAYVLYPGWFPEVFQTDPAANPYSEALEAVGIGAFPALPGHSNLWLTSFITEHLGRTAAKMVYRTEAPDRHLVQDSVRIAPTGLKLRRQGDLVFVAPVGPSRSEVYLSGFRNGTANWYHIRDEAIHRERIPAGVMHDVTHVAIAVPEFDGSVLISHIFDVRCVKRCDRGDISEFQAGTNVHSGSGEYWLFELGTATKLKQTVRLPAEKHFKFGMCSVTDLRTAKEWRDVSGRYRYLYSAPDESVGGGD